MGLALMLALLQSISGAYTGDWKSTVSGVEGTFRIEIARDADGKPRAEISYTIADIEIKTKVVHLKIEGGKIEAKYQYDLGDRRLQSTINGELVDGVLQGKYHAESVPDGSPVDEGTWKAAPRK